MIKKVATLALPEIPDCKAIKVILDHNKRFCNENNLEYEIIEKDFTYKTLDNLYKIEIEKWKYIICNPYVLLIDWDLILLEIPKNIEDNSFYLACKSNVKDSFVMLNTLSIDNDIYLYINKIVNVIKRGEKYIDLYQTEKFKPIYFNYVHTNTRMWDKPKQKFSKMKIYQKYIKE